MTDIEAIEARVSRRAYSGSVNPQQAGKLQEHVAGANLESGLTFCLEVEGGGAFGGITHSYGLFTGVHSLLVVAGRAGMRHLQEKAGYYGERLVLDAVKMGLGTCWVGGTFNHEVVASSLAPGLELLAVITVGPVKASKGFVEKAVSRVTGGKKRSGEEMSVVADGQTPPAWFMAGAKAAALAPSALNRQPVRFEWKDGQASAFVPGNDASGTLDLGIAKRHFEIAAQGSFALGNHGVFTPAGAE